MSSHERSKSGPASSSCSSNRSTRQPRPWNVRAALGAALAMTLCAPSLALLNAAEPPAAAKESAERQAATLREQFGSQVAPLLKQYCHACHAGEKNSADLRLDQLAAIPANADERGLWERVLKALEDDQMPPPDKPRPSAVERETLVRWLEKTLYNIDCSKPVDPGRVTIRRLNRVEYNHTIRDLLGVNFRPADDFPSDDVGHGFDNIADVLSISPLLVEKYLAAAERIAGDTLRAAGGVKPTRVRRDRRELTREGGARLSPFGIYVITSKGSVRGDFPVARRGEYAIRVRAAAQQAGDEFAKAEIAVDGRAIKTIDVDAIPDKAAEYVVRATLEPGTRQISATFVNDFTDPMAEDPQRRDRNLYLSFLEIEGPLDAPPEKSKTRFVLIRPGDDRSVEDAAQRTLAPLMRRAFRRPVTPEEVDRHVRFVRLAAERGDPYEQGVEMALASVLVSPHFLFRLESDPSDSASPANPPSTNPPAANPPAAKASEENAASPRVRSLNDHELATRLSYFLWSSMPDDALFELADRGELQRDETLSAQVRRMLADPKAEALAVNFGGQWLNLRLLDEITPDPQLFPAVTSTLRNDFRRETEMFFAHILREDRPIVEFLDADYTFVNERLAKHYGIADVQGDNFRQVALTGTRRAGVLTQASILTLTSNPTRTSPVKRGKWILENILGAPPPEPPPDVPQLEATQKAQPDATLRQQLEIHRRDANCAVCHNQMDAIGFSFENFDAVGRWRDRDGQHPIDASGELPGGRKFAGAQELIAILKARQLDFSRTLTERMLTYALGRGLERADRCAVDRIVEQLAAHEFRASQLVEAIVRSEPFRRRRVDRPN